MKQWIELFKDAWILCFVIFLIGISVGKIYTYDDILKDCKVLGMFRLGSTPIGCHVGDKYEEKK